MEKQVNKMNAANENPYVFISYAHANSNLVLPIITAMRNNNIRVWYDEGIVAGSEWPEFIAEKVVECTAFVLFVSNAYLESQNCKRELNFAISRKKNILSIFLEDVNLSPGMEMQLGTYQAIYRNRFSTAQEFYASLCQEPFFNPCRTSASNAKATAQQPTNQPPSGNAGQPVRNTSGTQTVLPRAPQTPPPSATQTVLPRAPQTPPPSATQTPPPRAPQSTFAETVQSVLPDSMQTAFSRFTQNTASQSTMTGTKQKNRIVAAVLAIFLGSFGAQHFYLRRILLGILSLLFIHTGIPAIVGIVQGVWYLRMSDEDFQVKHAKK